MRVPLGIATLEAGAFPADPISTLYGDVRVEAVGVRLRGAHGAAWWLRPRQARVQRPDGRTYEVRVHDGTGAVLAWITVSAVAVFVVLRLLRRKLH